MSRFSLNELSQVGQPIVMSLLADAAQRRETITYGNVADEIKRKVGGRFSRVAPLNIGYVVGSLMERILEVEPQAPPLNTLCVSGDKRLPGDGADMFVKKYLGDGIAYSKLPDKQKRELLLPSCSG